MKVARKKPKIRLVRDNDELEGRMRVISCYVTPAQDKALKELHKETRVPVAVIIREGVRKIILEKYRNSLPRFLINKIAEEK